MYKVLIIQEYIPQYRLPFFRLLRQEATRVGIDVTVAYGEPAVTNMPRRDAVEFDEGIRIPQREFKIAGRRLVLRRTSGLMQDLDLLICEQARRNLDLYRMLFPSSRRKHTKIALWGHGRDYTKRPSAPEKWLQQTITKSADWFFAYTEGGRKSAIADGFDSTKITVVQNAIDASSLKEAVDNLDEYQIRNYSERFGLKGKTSLFLGALDSSKRLDFLMEASAHAFRIDPDFRLLLGGDGPLRRQVETWSKSNSFVSFLGPLTGQSKALAMASSQALAMPGRVGLAAVDSFAAGLPIVTTEWPWHAPEFEYLTNGRNAVVTEDCTDVYAKTIVDLLNDNSRLHTLTVGARSDAETFTIDAMVNRFLSGIVEVLAVGQA